LHILVRAVLRQLPATGTLASVSHFQRDGSFLHMISAALLFVTLRTDRLRTTEA